MILVFPHKYVRGGEGTYPIRGDEAWTTAYDTDAHCVAYVLDGYGVGDRHPRINKTFGLRPRMHWRMVDCDNPRHEPWDDWRRGLDAAREIAQWLKPRPRIYVTRAGWRYVWPLNPPEEIGGELAALVRLHAQGVPVDFSCRDWTRLYRMPRATRDGVQLPYVGEGFE